VWCAEYQSEGFAQGGWPPYNLDLHNFGVTAGGGSNGSGGTHNGGNLSGGGVSTNSSTYPSPTSLTSIISTAARGGIKGQSPMLNGTHFHMNPLFIFHAFYLNKIIIILGWHFTYR